MGTGGPSYQSAPTIYVNDGRPSKTTLFARKRNGDPYRIRTDVKGVRGLCLNHLTNGPFTRYYTLKTEQKKEWQGCLHNCRSSPRAISTGRLNTLLRLHRRPINHVVYMDPYSIKDGRSYLRGSFTLRCLQRLSRPDIATQLCRWHDNWCTRGQSIPVLSY